MFAINNESTVFVGKWIYPDWTSIALHDISSQFNYNTDYTMRIEATGNRFAVYVDNNYQSLMILLDVELLDS